MKKRLLALALTGAMALSLLGISALAAEVPGEAADTGTTQEESSAPQAESAETQEGEDETDPEETPPRRARSRRSTYPTRRAPSPLKIWSGGCGRTI